MSKSGEVRNPVEGVDVYLQSEQSELWITIAQTLTNEGGYFEFANVPIGRYRVILDVPGLEITAPPIIDITEDGQIVDNIEFAITEEGINTVDIAVEAYRIRPIQIYPNPTTGELKIKNYELKIGIAGQARNDGAFVEIFDIFGRSHVSRVTCHEKEAVINISHLPSGVYFLRIDGQIVKVVKQ